MLGPSLFPPFFFLFSVAPTSRSTLIAPRLQPVKIQFNLGKTSINMGDSIHPQSLTNNQADSSRAVISVVFVHSDREGRLTGTELTPSPPF